MTKITKELVEDANDELLAVEEAGLGKDNYLRDLIDAAREQLGRQQAAAPSVEPPMDDRLSDYDLNEYAKGRVERGSSRWRAMAVELKWRRALAVAPQQQVERLYAALVVAQDIAIKAIHTPPISDPRWTQIADALAAAPPPVRPSAAELVLRLREVLQRWPAEATPLLDALAALPSHPTKE